MAWFGGHSPTSTTVEVSGFATDPRNLLVKSQDVV
jgi:hypothetical protein